MHLENYVLNMNYHFPGVVDESSGMIFTKAVFRMNLSINVSRDIRKCALSRMGWLHIC